MADKLFDLVYRVLVELDVVVEGTATGGSATTIIDTTATGRKEYAFRADNYWNGGTAGILKNANSAGAAPEGNFGEVTDYVKSTQTLTVDTLGGAVESGDRYFVAKNRYPYQKVIQTINRILRNTKTFAVDTSLETAANKLNYTLPSAVRGQHVKAVYLEYNTSNSNAPDPQPYANWEILYQGTGSQDILRFNDQPPTGRTIYIYYRAYLSDLYADTDALSEQVAEELIVQGAVVRILTDRIEIDESIIPKRNYHAELLDRAEKDFMDTQPKIPRQISTIYWGNNTYTYPGDRTVL